MRLILSAVAEVRVRMKLLAASRLSFLFRCKESEMTMMAYLSWGLPMCPGN